MTELFEGFIPFLCPDHGICQDTGDHGICQDTGDHGICQDTGAAPRTYKVSAAGISVKM